MLRRRYTGIAFVAAMLFARPVLAQNARYGVHTYALTPYLASKAHELGTGYVRIEIDWDQLQPDGPDQWNDRELLSWLALAREHHLKLYATLMNTPAWAGPCQHCMTSSNGAWQNFVYRVMREARRQYPDVEIVYGIWNEPNLTGPNGFFQGTDANYATLFSLADVARQQANPLARLAGPEMSVGGFEPRAYLDSVMKKLEQYLRRTDVITFHWYPGQGSLAEWAATFAAKSRGQEVWLTETGDNTCDDTEQRSWIDFILNTFDHAKVSAQWTKVFVYYLWDGATNCAANLVRIDGSNRPAFIDYQNRALRRWTAIQPVTLKTANGSALKRWPVLDLIDLNGTGLHDGDPVAFESAAGLFLQADKGGGGGLLEHGFAPSVWETFTVIDLDHPGGSVGDGDAVALKSSGGFYVSAELGDGATLVVDRSSIGAWETFRLSRGN